MNYIIGIKIRYDIGVIFKSNFIKYAKSPFKNMGFLTKR
jgi:hypothetical protein